MGQTRLHFTAGALWLGVGSMLIGLAVGWLRLAASPTEHLAAGITLAGGIYRLGFSRLAKKNIRRIKSMTARRTCVFAFQGWRSYALVAPMISLGIYLRRISSVPRRMLAVLCLGIGGGLMWSSIHHFVQAADHGGLVVSDDDR